MIADKGGGGCGGPVAVAAVEIVSPAAVVVDPGLGQARLAAAAGINNKHVPPLLFPSAPAVSH